MTKDNPFTSKAKRQLKPFGTSKNGSSAIAKPNPFAVVAKKIDIDEFELEQLDQQSATALAGYCEALDEAAKLFKKVDKISLRGQTHTQKYLDAKHDWDTAERRLDRAYGQMQSISTRRHALRHRRTNGSRTLRSKQSRRA